MFKEFINVLWHGDERYETMLEKEAEKQREEFKTNCPVLEAKRAQALAYLGDKWILKSKAQRITPRSAQ
jgi:hypothetical protein